MDVNQTNQTTFEENIPLENAKVKLEETPGVDLCFMLDCTGSMGSYIKMSCDKIKDIIVQVQDAYPKSEIKIGIVAYRDIGDTNRFELLPFVNSPQSAKDFLGKLVASGGNDAPEDVNGGFQQALFKLKWENPVRLLVLIADAPCHGTEFHTFGTGGDHYPKGHKDDMSWDKIFKQLIELRIDFLFLKITDYTDLMFKKFKEYADKHGAADAEINFTQELANKASAEAQATRPAGGKAPSKAEDHFAATIAHTIKVSLNKEMKKGLQTKLNKRVEENADLVNNIKKNVADTVSKLDLEDIRSKYSDLAAKVGDCILSSNNFVDALADEDCLCLTFDIGRSQAAIADPTQIIIKNVYPSFLTAGSFFYSTEYALKKNKLAHGGFEKHAEGLILKGAASENITGVMPLYFCEENWQVAKQLMKLTIAWDVTLDPLGYSYLQIKTVPFLILAKLAEMVNEKPSVEFLKFQFEMVKRTCMKIMEDGSKEGFERKFSQEVIDLYNKYVEDASTRTIDSIANNSVFLSQLYIASECGMVPRKSETYFDEMFKGMFEEELRRKQRNFPEDFNTDEWLLKILNVDIENDIAKPVQEYIDNQDNKSALSGYEQKFLALVKETEPVEEKKVEEKITTVKVTTNGAKSTSDYKQSFTDGDGYNEIQTKAREEYNQTLKRVMTYLYPLRMLFTSKQAENPVNFKEWDIQSDSQFFALYIQNKLHSKNAARREAIAGGIYKNPWTQSEEFIKNWYNKAVEDEKAKRISRYIDSAKNSQAAVFAFSSNLNEAAGALLGTRIGLDVMKFWNKLCEGGIPLVDEKAKMMLTGHYKGVGLYQDAYGWKAGRKNRNKLYRVTQKYY